MNTLDVASVTGVVWRRVDPAREAEAEKIMREVMLLARASKGFLGSEIFPPVHGIQEAHVVIYRFERSENLRAWLQSPERTRLLAQIEDLLVQPSFEFFVVHGRRPAGCASSVFSYHIRPGCEAQFADWRSRIQDTLRQQNGYLGIEAFEALEGGQPEVVIVIRFQSRATLDAWLHSGVRGTYLAELGKYVENYRVRRISSGFEGWFDTSADVAPPARWRQGLSILAVLFPVILVLRQAFAGLFVALPFPVAFLILLTIDVTLLTFVLMPNFSRWMNFWLRPRPDATWRTEFAGWAVLLGLIGLTLALALILGV